MKLPQRRRRLILPTLALLGVLGSVMVAGAHAAPAKHAANEDSLPWVYSGWFTVNPSSAAPGTKLQFEAVLNLTDAYKAATSANGLKRVKTVIHLPPGTSFAKKPLVMRWGCSGVPKSWCKVSAAERSVVVRRTSDGVTLTWNSYHVRWRPTSALVFWPRLPKTAAGQFCGEGTATPHGAGNDPSGNPATPATEQACVEVTAGGASPTSP